MSKKVVDAVITLLAIAGVIVLIGTVGDVDYLTMVGKDCSLPKVIFCTILGISMIIPAIIREVI